MTRNTYDMMFIASSIQFSSRVAEHYKYDKKNRNYIAIKTARGLHGLY